MAKGKHSAALFEVIKHQSSRPERSASRSKPPKWWFMGGQATETRPTVEASYTEAEQPETPALAIAREPARRSPRRSDSNWSSAVHLDFDRVAKEVTLRLRYTTAIVSLFAMCALIGLAYVIGGHLSHEPLTVASDAHSTTIQQLLKQPPQVGVIVLNRPKPPRPAAVDVPTPVPVETPVANVDNSAPTATVSLVPSGAETRLPRTIGLNYAIVQTYPPEEQQTAEAARDFLISNGIPCTLETTDYVRNPRWLCLVGTAGFTKISSQDYKAYVDSIVRLGQMFPSSHFDRFKPAAYKWKG